MCLTCMLSENHFFTGTKKSDAVASDALIEVLNGFEPMIRELQSHALPLGYSTILILCEM